jgi:hypothetical protein
MFNSVPGSSAVLKPSFKVNPDSMWCDLCPIFDRYWKYSPVLQVTDWPYENCADNPAPTACQTYVQGSRTQSLTLDVCRYCTCLQVTDWADGYLARRLGHTSKLGSYLDPLADKVLIASVVGTMGWNSMLPGWLAVLVVGRDTAQVAGMFVYRFKMFGGKWPGATAFFDVDAAVPQQQQQQQQKQQDASANEGSHTGVFGQQANSGIDSSNSRSSTSTTTDPTAAAAAESGLPSIKPLMVSKVNTALVLLLVAGCMTQQWQGLPGQEVLDALEMAVAGTTAASAAAYARLHWTGQLLSSSKA